MLVVRDSVGIFTWPGMLKMTTALSDTFGLNSLCLRDEASYKTYQKAMYHHHPAPAPIWRVFILDLFLLLLLTGHGILPEQIHGCLNFTKRKKKEYVNSSKSHRDQKHSLHQLILIYSKMYDKFSRIVGSEDINKLMVFIVIYFKMIHRNRYNEQNLNFKSLRHSLICSSMLIIR